MRRSERHKFIKISIIFVVYSIIHAVSTTNKSETHTGTDAAEGKTVGSPTIPISLKVHSTQSTAHVIGHSTTAAPKHKISEKESKSDDKHHETPEKKIEAKEHEKVVGPNASDNSSAIRPKHEKNEENVSNATIDCTPAAIRQFPRPLMHQDVRKHGGLIIHTLVAIYMFIGLAVVCDEYFVASLDRICEELKMSPDVAGATFMAAGSSAPELATVIIGVFYAEDDIGISGVIGSAVFNIMFVISVCALSTGAIVYLNWWPLVRDSIFYALSILIMLAVIGDKGVNWIESTVMLVTYAIYCVVLHFNPQLEKWAQTLPLPFKTTAPNEQSGLVSYKNLEDERKHTNYGMEWNNEQPSQQQQQQPPQSQWSPGQEWSPDKHPPGENFQEPLSGAALNQASNEAGVIQSTTMAPAQQDYYRPKEYDPATKVNPLVKPAAEAGEWAKFKWYTLYPIHFFCIYTMPDCRSEKYRNWYPFTFFVSMVWISFYSYFMVWMITIIGYTLGIPDTVMGLTFVAAGVSVPDALSSIAVIKEGYGDMAVSNAIGSNVFDILVCLGLPWFIKTAIVQPGSRVKVTSKGLMYSTFSLLSTVAFLVVAIHYNGWKLDRRFGIILMIWYLVFITFASLYELNVFGNLNPPECPTDY
ncbi:hypothetical protein GWI33_012690 [Rhynchophorus ferrugineus]|uniref:Sodium/calcium exchanger membrane region domain-containing protein n=1 Tax=Rhynchophorus ferrugineus TaxID=354439 RepID=A0A834IB73_RHYFE|nr:hypothetical protein GWI33_012690 [Rhynchophorus ferrugineus]